jgi:superfamily I DNA and/or RNA helicase
LEKHYNLHISLFERLVGLKIPKKALTTQLRMRPEIANLTRKFYGGVVIEDHPRVMNFPNIKGVEKNIFFLSHSFPELENQEGKAKV